MSDTTRTPRGLAALALTGSALVAFSGAALAAPPEPSAGVTASCTNDLASGNYQQYVAMSIDAAYKGRWVDFRVTVRVPGASNSPKSRPVVRHDSSTAWTDTFTFLTLDSTATSANVEVQMLDNKGVPVGSPASWSGGCTTGA